MSMEIDLARENVLIGRRKERERRRAGVAHEGGNELWVDEGCTSSSFVCGNSVPA